MVESSAPVRIQRWRMRLFVCCMCVYIAIGSACVALLVVWWIRFYGREGETESVRRDDDERRRRRLKHKKKVVAFCAIFVSIVMSARAGQVDVAKCWAHTQTPKPHTQIVCLFCSVCLVSVCAHINLHTPRYNTHVAHWCRRRARAQLEPHRALPLNKQHHHQPTRPQAPPPTLSSSSSLL